MFPLSVTIKGSAKLILRGLKCSDLEYENDLFTVALPDTEVPTQGGCDVRNAHYFQEKAGRCRGLSVLATQLRLWAREFEDLADSIENEDRPELEGQEAYGGWVARLHNSAQSRRLPPSGPARSALRRIVIDHTRSRSA
jgi:hypothetical protein